MSKIKFGFAGKYCVKAEELANDAMNYFDCSEEQAKRLGVSFMADFGQGVKKSDESKQSLGRANKDGEVTMTDLIKIIHQGKATPALSIARVIQQMNALLKEGVVYNECKLSLVTRLNDWLFVEATVAEVKA